MDAQVAVLGRVSALAADARQVAKVVVVQIVTLHVNQAVSMDAQITVRAGAT